MLNYISYSLIFFKLWYINKIYLGVPFRLIKNLVLLNIVNLTCKGGQYIINGVGSYVYPSPLVITDDDTDDNINN